MKPSPDLFLFDELYMHIPFQSRRDLVALPLVLVAGGVRSVLLSGGLLAVGLEKVGLLTEHLRKTKRETHNKC